MGEKKLTIYFTSDLHGFLYPTDYKSRQEADIGLFKLANRFHKDGNTLILDGGDLLQGSPLDAYCHDTLQDPKPLAGMMNLAGYDFVTLGNHDFNFGQDYLNAYLSALDAQCLCQNVSDAAGCKFPFAIKTLENGLKIGLVGLVTDYVNVWEKPDHLQGLTISDPIAAAKTALAQLKGQVDLTVGIYHGGFERDLASGRLLSQTRENIAYQICQQLDFDVLLTGHQHMSLPGQFLFGTYIVQPFDKGRQACRLEITVGETGLAVSSETLLPQGDVPKSWLEAYAEVAEGAQTWLDEVVAHLPAPLEPASPLRMASEGTPLAALLAEVEREFTGADIAVSSLANEITGLPQIVRRRDLLNTYPYANTLVVLEVTGQVLREVLERSGEYFDYDPQGRLEVSHRFLEPKVEHYNYDYYSGVHYMFDVSRPLGQRVTQLTRNGKAISDSDRFSLCLSSYRASGTGGYDAYTTCKVLKEDSTDMSDLLLDFFARHGENLPPLTFDFQVV